MAKAKYGVGEIVIVSDPIGGASERLINQQVTITEIQGGDSVAYYARTDRGVSNFFMESELSPADTKTTKREDKTCEVKGCKQDRLLFEHYCSTHIHQYGNKKSVPVTVDNKPVENTIEQLILIEGEHYAIDGYGEELSNGSRWAVLRKVEL